MPTEMKRVTLIAGATASGKSALALDLAEQRDGIIINADSMQVYEGLRILTARPADEDMRLVPHRLYGHISPDQAYSVSHWLDEVARELAVARVEQRPIFIVGGTGLYFKALTEGLSPVPKIPAEVRALWRSRAEDDPDRLHTMLFEKDPQMAERLSPRDAQRIVRALEVMDATGRSLADWQRQKGQPLVDAAGCDRIVVSRPRDELRTRCDRRFDDMIASGALDEVASLMQRNLPPDVPAMRAIGVSPLVACLRGQLSLAEAIERGKAETRQYLKRQETWARKFMSDWLRPNLQ